MSSFITISFISAGLISLSGGLGLIFGANIGTTATAWLVAGFGLKIKIASLAMPMLIFGLIFSFKKNLIFKGIGNVLAGLGFFFLGIYYMKEGFDVGMEMSGNKNAFMDMLKVMCHGAKIAMLGIMPEPAEINWDYVVFNMLTINS